MMFKLIILGAVGYVGYRYFNSGKAQSRRASEVRIAGGPLSSAARVQQDPNRPPSL